MNHAELTCQSPYSEYIVSRIRRRARDFIAGIRPAIQQLLFRAAMALSEDCGLLRHAKRELQAAGYKLDDKEEGPKKWLQQNLLDLLAVFTMQGHSGFSAPYCIEMFQKLAKFDPLGPLTGADDEWNEVCSGGFQNNRCGHVFKMRDRFDGQPYDMEAVIFWEWYERPLEPDEEGYPGFTREKSHFTSSDSARVIEFPYTPKREYQERLADAV